MGKIVFNFFEAYMEDDEVSSFLKKIEEVLRSLREKRTTSDIALRNP